MPTPETVPLNQMHVAFTGRSMSFSRSQAERLVKRLGGNYQPDVNHATELLVVGGVGWPLQKNGRLTKNLAKAKQLQRQGCPLQIESEEDFLRRIGAASQWETQLFTMPQLSRLCDLTPQQLMAWYRIGLLSPSRVENSVTLFDFRQVTRCRTLAELLKSRIGRKRFRRVISALRAGELNDHLLERLVVLESQLAIRNSDGLLYAPNGQQLFDFSQRDREPTIVPSPWLDSDFDLGVRFESQEDWDAAEEVYRGILEKDPDDSDVLYNLANVLVHQNRMGEAIPYYEEAIFYDPDFAEAWNNLGNALSDSGKSRAALVAYRQAIHIDPEFGSALFGIACVLDECGRRQDADRYCGRFLAGEPGGDRADYALQRLERI